MKRIFFCLLLITAANSVFAQIRLGAIAGVTFANQKWVSNTQTMPGIGTSAQFHIGATADVPISAELSIQPELYYSSQGTSLSSNFPLISNYNKFNLGYLKLPVLLTYMYDANKMFWYAGVGPYIGRLAYNNYSFIQNEKRLGAGSLKVGTTADQQITPYDFGIKGKIGFELKKGINFGFYYEHGLKDINPQLVQTYTRTYGASLSYLFSITNEDVYNRYPDYYNH